MNITGHIRNGVVVPDRPIEFPDGTPVRLEFVTDQNGHAGELKRQGGVWKGRVQMSDDFDELPADIASSFGMDPR